MLLLWHCKMGHLSDKRLDILRKQYPYINIERHFFVMFVIRPNKESFPLLLVILVLSKLSNYCTWIFGDPLLTLLCNQFNTNVQTIRTNNGVEFAMENFFLIKGIMHQKYVLKHLSKMEFVERKHQHLLNIIRALLFQANLPPIFWSFVAQNVALLINCTLIDNTHF